MLRADIHRIGSALTVSTDLRMEELWNATLNPNISLPKNMIVLSVVNFCQQSISWDSIRRANTPLFSNNIKLHFIIFIEINCDAVVDIVLSKMYKIDTSEVGEPVKWDWRCTDCDYRSPHGTTMKRHIESKHIGKLYVCEICQHKFSTQNAMNGHKARLHGCHGDPLKYPINSY